MNSAHSESCHVTWKTAGRPHRRHQPWPKIMLKMYVQKSNVGGETGGRGGGELRVGNCANGLADGGGGLLKGGEGGLGGGGGAEVLVAGGG